MKGVVFRTVAMSSAIKAMLELPAGSSQVAINSTVDKIAYVDSQNRVHSAEIPASKRDILRKLLSLD